MRWMNLEPVIQNEVSQKEKDKCHILTHIYRIQKNGTDEFIYRTAKQTYGHGERGAEGEMYGKSNMELTLSYVKLIDIRNSGICCMAQETQTGSVSTQSDGIGDGREVQKGADICIPMADSC